MLLQLSELTSIAVISVTGVCLRQRDNEQRQMRACKTERHQNTITPRKQTLRTIWWRLPWVLSSFQPIVVLLSMENYPRSFVPTWIVMSAWRGAMQRKRRHTNTNTLKHINVQKPPPVGVWFTGWRLAETDDRAYCHRPVSLTAEPQSRCQHIAEKWLAF